METIILDITRKSELLLKREKKKFLSSIHCKIGKQNAEIIEPINECDRKLKEIYKYTYPINKSIRCKEFNVQKISIEFNFRDGDTIVLPYFDNTKYWLSVILYNKIEFLKNMFEKGYFNSLSMIFLREKLIYDVELGEQEYDLRIYNY